MKLRGLNRFFLLLAVITSTTISHAQYSLDTLSYAGNSSKYTDFVFLGDGFTESQMSQFKSAIEKNVNYLFKKEHGNITRGCSTYSTSRLHLTRAGPA